MPSKKTENKEPLPRVNLPYSLIAFYGIVNVQHSVKI